MSEGIRIQELTESDVGRWVKYCPRHYPVAEVGRIKSWNKTWIFVVYNCDNDWDNFENYTGAATSPEELVFIEAPKE